jgi:deoxyribose-phosphate aldolase
LKDSKVKVCTVIGFPLGENTTRTKVFETKDAIKNGAQEIDMVINLSWAKSNQWKKVAKEIGAVVKAAAGVPVKVIIETCLLDNKKIVKACLACIEGGAQWVKTSTGFSLYGAKAEHIKLIAQTLKGTDLKIKASGGIRDKAAALEMIEAGAQRIGTSSGVKIVSE